MKDGGQTVDSPRYIQRPPRLRDDMRDLNAILATAENGRALRIERNGRTLEQIVNSPRERLKRLGYRLHYRTLEDSAVALWVVKL